LKFVFNGNHVQLRALTASLGHRMEYMETDGNLLIVHIDSTQPAIVAQVAAMPGVSMLPDGGVALSDTHVKNLSRFGIAKGDTVHVALQKIFAQHPHAIANTDLPIH
jgi:prophage tail gpP-like protein